MLPKTGVRSIFDLTFPKVLFPTTVVGSMPRPRHIKDLIQASDSGDAWEKTFQKAMDIAIPYIVQMQESAGIEILSDGEWRRKSYIGIIADICSGFEFSTRKVNGQLQSWHIVKSKMEMVNSGCIAKEANFLKQHTSRQIKVALPSPYLLGERMWDPESSKGAYPTRRDFTEALVPVLRQEVIAIRDEGVAIVQFDDPSLCLFVDPRVQAQYEDASAEIEYAVELLNETVSGIDNIKLALHLCRRNKGRSGWIGEGGYEPILPALKNLVFDALMLEFAMPAAGDKNILAKLPERFEVGLGCVDCRNPHIDTPDEIINRVKQALNYLPPERIFLHPDCGFAPGSSADIPLDEVYLKLQNEVLAAKKLRTELV